MRLARAEPAFIFGTRGPACLSGRLGQSVFMSGGVLLAPGFKLAFYPSSALGTVCLRERPVIVFCVFG